MHNTVRYTADMVNAWDHISLSLSLFALPYESHPLMIPFAVTRFSSPFPLPSPGPSLSFHPIIAFSSLGSSGFFCSISASDGHGLHARPLISRRKYFVPHTTYTISDQLASARHQSSGCLVSAHTPLCPYLRVEPSRGFAAFFEAMAPIFCFCPCI